MASKSIARKVTPNVGLQFLLFRQFVYALWAEATENIQKFGTIVKSPSSYPIQSPYVAIANRQAEIMMRIASEFGFTPASRSRISVSEPPVQDLFNRVAAADAGD